jgi:predicted HD superfamily hydrolase involved in NAD metabolism
MQVMGSLAKIYGFDHGKAQTAGLLHDAAKDLEPSRQKEIEHEAGIEIRCECDKNFHYYLHGPIGAYLVKRDLGIQDPVILDAIAFHTYYGHGKNFSAPITWCLRFSDVLEPTRDWSNVKWLCENVDRLADVVYSGRLEEGAFLQTGWLIKWFEEDGKPVHPNMYRIYRRLSAKLGKGDSFLL